jgi:hypothetical protein
MSSNNIQNRNIVFYFKKSLKSNVLTKKERNALEASLDEVIERLINKEEISDDKCQK